MVMQQLLIPYASGDERLLIPGWAGEISDDELTFIQERLRRYRKLLRQWKIANRSCPEYAIRNMALFGIVGQLQQA
jgi:hypothetical protein